MPEISAHKINTEWLVNTGVPDDVLMFYAIDSMCDYLLEDLVAFCQSCQALDSH